MEILGYCLFRRAEESDLQWGCCKILKKEVGSFHGEIVVQSREQNFDLQSEDPDVWEYTRDYEAFEDECGKKKKSLHDP